MTELDEYISYLDRARSMIPKKVFEYARFTIKKVDLFSEGNRTIIQNFKEIAELLNRDPSHLLKYLNRELATRGNIQGGRAIFVGKFNEFLLNSLIKRYADKYVLCPVCHRPDTRLIKEDKFLFIQCDACGAKESLKSAI
ncbi:MAG: translation initiation factor IF-2 subunit beta [Candidatus Helarchaeota archaeon]